MPNTAVDDVPSSERLSRLEVEYNKERTARKAVEARFREHEVMWEKQQTLHEDLTREYRLLLGKQKSADERLDGLTKNTETLRDRLATRTTELRELSDRLEEQRSTHLLSGDEKLTEITKLRTELATAKDEMQRHLKSAQTAEATLEYMKEQYRLARDAATSSQTTIDELGAQNAKLAHQASGQPEKLKAMHLDRQYQNLESQIKSLRAENSNLKKTLQQRDDDLLKARTNVGRAGVGTRATSATPQPRVRSRAASPMGGRLSNLRSG
jgi:chromosome segregation ATPase